MNGREMNMSRGMMMFVLFTSVLLAGAVTTRAASPGVDWVKEYGDSGLNSALWIEECSTGGYVVSGQWSGNNPNHTDALLMRLDEDGDTLWTKTWGGPLDDIMACVRETSDRGFILAGYTETAPDTFDVWFIRTDAYGDTLWTSQFDFGPWEFILNVMEMPGEGFLGCGYGVPSPVADNDVLVLMIDEAGHGKWKLWVEKPGYDRGIEMCRTYDGNVAVAGYTATGSDQGDIYVVKVDLAGRDTMWTRTFPDTATKEIASGICEAHDGGLAVCGGSTDMATLAGRGFLLKTDDEGRFDWMEILGSPGEVQYMASVIATPDMGFALGGRRDAFSTGAYDFYFVKTDAFGDTLWTKTLLQKERQVLVCMTMTSDYGYASCGEARVGTSLDRTVWLTKLTEDDAGVEPGKQVKLPPLLAIKGAGPFTGSVRVAYDIPAAGYVRLAVFDVSGRQVVTLAEGARRAGTHEVTWDCLNPRGERVTSGMYFIRCETPGRSAVEKALVIR
jgi:hypothetical protein